MQQQLIAKLEEWASSYSIDHVWNGEGNAFEQEIVDLAAALPAQELDCMLYRGTGLDDGIPTGLLAGECNEVPASQRVVQSWTKDIAVARSFLENAVNTNHSGVLLAVHSSRLQVVADISALIHEPHGESEVLVRNVALHVTAADVLEAWEYDEDAEECFKVDNSASKGIAP